MSTGPGTAGHPDQDPAADGPGGDWAPAAGEAGPAGAGPRDTELVAARWRQWRHGRPFWGGAFVVAGAAVTLLSERAPLPLIVHIGVQGVAGYLVPVMLLVCGLLLWFHPAQRTFYSILAVLLALGSWITSNLGGFFGGMLLGLLGGSLGFAWERRDSPPATRPARPPPPLPSAGVSIILGNPEPEPQPEPQPEPDSQPEPDRELSMEPDRGQSFGPESAQSPEPDQGQASEPDRSQGSGPDHRPSPAPDPALGSGADPGPSPAPDPALASGADPALASGADPGQALDRGPSSEPGRQSGPAAGTPGYRSAAAAVPPPNPQLSGNGG